MEPTAAQPISEVLDLMRRQQRECLEILERLRNGESSLYKVRMSVNTRDALTFINGCTSLPSMANGKSGKWKRTLKNGANDSICRCHSAGLIPTAA